MTLKCTEDERLIINVDLGEEIKQYANQFDLRNLMKLMDLFLKMREYVAFNANLNLVIANIFSQMSQFIFPSTKIECEVK